jgi:hypothetical protein
MTKLHLLNPLNLFEILGGGLFEILAKTGELIHRIKPS